MAFRLAELFLEIKTHGAKETAEALDVVKGKLLGIPPMFQVFEQAMDRIHDFVSESVEIFEREEKATTKLAAMLQTTGHAAGYTSDQLKEMADHLSSVTAFSPTNILEAMATLTRFPAIQGETYARSIRLSADLAAAGMGSVEAGAMAIGRALENPAHGMFMLSRAGVVLTQSEREHVQALVASGQQYKAQQYLLDSIEKTVGGLAEKLVTPADKLHAKMEAIQTAIGSGIVPAMNAFMDRLTSAAPDAEKLGAAFKGVGSEIAAIVTGLGSADKAANELSLDLLAMRSMQSQDWLSKTLTGSNQGKGFWGTAGGLLGNTGSATGSLLEAIFGPENSYDKEIGKTARARTPGGKGEDPRGGWEKFWDRFQTRLVGDEMQGIGGGIKRDPANPDNLPPELLALKQRNERRLAALNGEGPKESVPSPRGSYQGMTADEVWEKFFPTHVVEGPMGKNLTSLDKWQPGTRQNDTLVAFSGLFDAIKSGVADTTKFSTSKFADYFNRLPELAKLAEPLMMKSFEQAAKEKTLVNPNARRNAKDRVIWVGGKDADRLNAEEERLHPTPKVPDVTFHGFDEFAKSLQSSISQGHDPVKQAQLAAARAANEQLKKIDANIQNTNTAIAKINMGFA